MDVDKIKHNELIQIITTNPELLIHWNELFFNYQAAYLLDSKGNKLGKFDEQKYNELNEFQLMLFEFSKPYRELFIEPFETSIN